ncbi:MAG: hypothetical protein MUE97_00525 [Phycisphaerales bacterium]|jgi:hypothetical protein|nr:hypothetical protein [Phycisphaerales bacterium]
MSTPHHETHDSHGHERGHTPSHSAGQGPVRPLTPAELLQLASADALGLLDEQERRDFEAAFAAAKPAHQALIRSTQDRVVQQQMAMLPDVKAPLGLRTKFFAKLASLMGAEQAPVLATIGTPTGTDAADLERRLSRTLPKVASVNRWWRTGAIAGIAAALLLGVTSVQLRSELERIDRGIVSNNTIGALAQQFGPAFESTLMADNAQVIALKAVDAGANASGIDGVVIVDASTGTGHLLCRGLPEGVRSLTLTATAPGGEQQTVILTFSPAASRAVQQLNGLKLAAGSTLDLRVTGSNEILLRGRVG